LSLWGFFPIFNNRQNLWGFCGEEYQKASQIIDLRSHLKQIEKLDET